MINKTKTTMAFVLIASAIFIVILFSYNLAGRTTVVEDYEYVPAVGEVVLNRSDSGSTTVMIGSYTCSHCKSFYEGTFQEILKNVDATIVYRHAWPTSLTQRSSALLTSCAPDNSASEVIDRFYFNQSELIKVDDINDIYEIAGIPKSRRDEVRNCAKLIDSDMLKDQKRDQDRFDIKGTPTTIVDGVVFTGNHPYSAFDFHE